MTVKERIDRFVGYGFGMFVHFGLYSIIGRGEWHYDQPFADKKAYMQLPKKFKVKKTWAKELVKTAKEAGCKYITLTTRHHDGFSLYDTQGLNDFDAPHSACGRDLIREFVDACRAEGIMPFFYHTLLDWTVKEFNDDFPKYIDYLIKSVEILCKNYGEIGGLWFDGMWSKPNEDWQEDRLYSTIRKYQPDAMIINNTGLVALGKVGHPEIDSVTFERGAAHAVENADRPRAGEMCMILNDHWGYAKEDINYFSVKELLYRLIDCRKYSCNYLLNVGPTANGTIKPLDKALFGEIGKWVKENEEFVRNARYSPLTAKGAEIVKGKDCHYAIVKDVAMWADPNVQLSDKTERKVTLENAEIESAEWLVDGAPIEVTDGKTFGVPAYFYGESKLVRVAKLKLKE